MKHNNGKNKEDHVFLTGLVVLCSTGFGFILDKYQWVALMVGIIACFVFIKEMKVKYGHVGAGIAIVISTILICGGLLLTSHLSHTQSLFDRKKVT